MSEPLYVVAWESRVTGKTGRGESAMTYSATREVCRKMNRECPIICHWPEIADVFHGQKEVPHE